MTLFWAAFILTRPLGATLGDLLDKPLANGCSAISRYLASAILAGLIVALIAVLPKRAAPIPAPRAKKRDRFWALESARLHLRNKIADVLEVNRNQAHREVVAHAGNDDQFAAGMLSAMSSAAAAGMTVSSAPCRTSAGQRNCLKSALRGGAAIRAAD